MSLAKDHNIIQIGGMTVQSISAKYTYHLPLKLCSHALSTHITITTCNLREVIALTGDLWASGLALNSKFLVLQIMQCYITAIQILFSTKMYN